MPTTKISSDGVTFPDASVQAAAAKGDYVAGGELGINSAGEVYIEDITSYTKKKAIRVGRNGTITVAFDGKWAGGSGGKALIYRNGAAVGTERTLTTSYVTYTENISVIAGDTVELWLKASGTPSFYAYAQNFKLTLATADTVSFRDES